MRYVAVLVFVFAVVGGADAEDRRFVTSSRLTLGNEVSLSASVRIADLDRSGASDVVIANGRHWPGQNYVLLNQGRARFSVQLELGAGQRTSYAAEPADLDGDGDIDIAVGNDMAPNRVLFNDGNGNFEPGPPFGAVASLRSLTVADIDGDGDLDLLSTCRGMANQIYLNDGDGRFAEGRPFGTTTGSTICVAVADWNEDGHLDLILANRDNQRNSILLNDGSGDFETEIAFGTTKEQTRAVAVADVNGDGHSDVIAANIGQVNHVYFSDGEGGFAGMTEFGSAKGRSYAVAAADMDNDGLPDVVVGNVGQSNAVFFTRDNGTRFSEVRFGDPAAATYGIDTGDLDGDGFEDIATANSGSQNYVFLNRPAPPNPTRTKPQSPNQPSPESTAIPSPTPERAAPQKSDRGRVGANQNWSSFRGDQGRGISDGFPVRTSWDVNADDASGILWTTPVPGLGHSSPVIFDDRLFLATAIADSGTAPLKVGRGGQPDAADDNGEQSWVVLCYDRHTGEELWRRTARRGKPRATRHAKATHANTSVAVDGENVVAFFGSEGIHCFDLEGHLKWSQDLGVINISKYGIGWGFASSPAIHQDRTAIVCDDPDDPFVAALRLSDGEEIWRTSRKEICERSWGTPFVHAGPDRTQVVVNGWPWMVAYDLDTGEPLWRIRGGGDNPVPTPFEANGWLYLTNAHGAESPIFVVRPDAEGDITPPEETGANESIVWSTRRGGSYMSTPVVYGDYLYLGNTNGVVRCFHARTGEKIYEKRLDSGASVIASLVAADGKIYCASENGTMYVLEAGSEFKILAENPMGDPCFATPAISGGVLYVRTTKSLIAIR